MCAECDMGYHHDCPNMDEEERCCCHEENSTPVAEEEEYEAQTQNSMDSGPGLRRQKTEGIKDPGSTGRKRAVIVAPIEIGKTKCEWAGLKNGGGGAHPIIGCIGLAATNVHHGPDKNTLNNSPENLHRICATCHNRWHSRNDAGYISYMLSVEDNPAPHDPGTMATLIEMMINEAEWSAKK